MRISLVLSMSALVGLGSCGKSNDSEETTTTAVETGVTPASSSKADQATTSKLAEDTQLSSEEISSNADDAITAMAGDEIGNATGGLSLLDSGAKEKSGTRTEERNCTVDSVEGKTTVTVSRSSSKLQTFDRKKISRELSHTSTNSNTRIWSKPGIEIPCSESKTHIKLAFADRAGATLVDTFKRESTQKLTSTQNGVAVVRSRAKSATGTTTTKWTAAAATGANVVMNKEVKIDLSKNSTVVDKDAKEWKISTTLKTKDDAPLKIELTRAKESGEVSARKLISGTLIATRTEGGRTEMTYDNVVFPSASVCQATSGKITGGIFAKDATTATVTFTIDFSAENPVVTRSDGKTSDFDTDGCDLDAPARSSIKRLVSALKDK